MTREPHRGRRDSSKAPADQGNGRGTSDVRAKLEDEARAGEEDQSLSDANQTASDADQTLADADQTLAESDQRASDRDQAAADRGLGSHPDDAELEDYRRSRAARAVGGRERQSGTLIRLRTAAARDAQAAQRDAIAAKRDLAASTRDELAISLEREAEVAAAAVGQPGDDGLRNALSLAAAARQNAATDRARAARDRVRAASDRERAAKDRDRATRELQDAHLDELTGVYRRGMGEALLHHELLRASRSGDPLAVAFVDVDHLKEVNDRDGYAAGDQLLRSVADALLTNLRPYDAVVRLGGDEFLCALSGLELDEARRRLDRINESLEDASFTAGVTAARPDDTVATVLARSNGEMREVRGSGKRFPPS